jgi:hypothetical protein
VYRNSSSEGAYSYLASLTSTFLSYTDNGLPANAVYFYKVSAYNDAGESSLSSFYRGMTNPPDNGGGGGGDNGGGGNGGGNGGGGGGTNTPAAPTISGIQLMPNEAGLTISWGSVTNATSYKVTRASSKNGSYSTITQINNKTAYDDTTVNLNSAGTSYWYEIIAVNSTGTESSPSAGKGITVPQSRVRVAINVSKRNGAIRLTTIAGVNVIDLLATPAGYTTSYRSIDPGNYKVFIYMSETAISSVPSASWVDRGTYTFKPYNSYTVTITGANSNQVSATPIDLVVLE